MVYTIITACKNESRFIEHTLASVCSQSILPIKWIIVNDNSDDNTLDIIEKYKHKHNWIELYTLENFHPELKATGGRVAALLNFALSKIKFDKEIGYIAKIDADVSFDENFFHNLLNAFTLNKKLGIASGHLYQNDIPEKFEEDSNRGAVMLIKSEILYYNNGFFISKVNGEDTLLSASARFQGYQTKTFPFRFNHLKPEGIKKSNFYNHWITGYYKGAVPYNIVYFLLTQFKHIMKKPFLIGSLLQIYAYIWSRFIVNYRPFPKHVAYQLHKEQSLMIKKFLFLN